MIRGASRRSEGLAKSASGSLPAGGVRPSRASQAFGAAAAVSKFWGKKTEDQQAWEMRYIKNNLLKGAILGATKGRADAAWNSST